MSERRATARSRKGLGRWTIFVGAAVVAMTVLVATASGDNVTNDIANNGPGNTAFTVGDPVIVDYWIVANGAGGNPGCDAADGTPAVVTIPTVAGVTTSTNTLTFTQCGVSQQVTFNTAAPDTYQIPAVTVTDAGPSQYGVGNTSFQIKWDPRQGGGGGGDNNGNGPPPPTTTAPTANAGGPYSGNEGSPIGLDASTSTGTGPLGYAWSFNDNGNMDGGGSCSFSSATVATPTITCTDDSNGGHFTVSVTVTNGAGSDTKSADLTVANVAPGITGLSGDTNVNEGSATHTYTYSIVDPGSNDSQTVAVSCGSADGAAVSNATNNATGGSFDCTFPDGEVPAGVSTISVQATDDESVSGSASTLDVTVNNVAPTVSNLAGDTSVNENGSSTHHYTYSISDPGTLDSVSNVAVSCGTENDATLSNAQNTNSGGSFDCLFPDGEVPAAASTVSAQATDDDGSTGNNATLGVTVNNVNPSVSPLSASINTSNACIVSLGSVGFSDPGAGYDVNYTGSISWGDAGSTSLGPMTSYAPPFLGPFSHTYLVGGNYTIGATVTDGDGGASSASTTAINNTFAVVGWPVPPIMSGKTFKAGSTIPVKIQTTGCTGGEAATISLDPATGTVKSSGNSNDGIILRYSAGMGYIYNFSTKANWPTGSYTVTVTFTGPLSGSYSTGITLTK
jgi:PKD domain